MPAQMIVTGEHREKIHLCIVEYYGKALQTHNSIIGHQASFFHLQDIEPSLFHLCVCEEKTVVCDRSKIITVSLVNASHVWRKL
jgi:hypothetical protein